MNDRYLFRGKRVDNGEWVVGMLTKMWGQLHIITNNDENTAYAITPETVGQCTGLKDKNGKLIFEGDMLENYTDYEDTLGYTQTLSYFGTVVWDEKNYCWGVKVDDEIRLLNDWDWDISMLLGNIHDNPELLEVKE